MVIVGYDSGLGKCFGPELLHLGAEMLAHVGLVARSCIDYLVLTGVPSDTPKKSKTNSLLSIQDGVEYLRCILYIKFFEFLLKRAQ